MRERAHRGILSSVHDEILIEIERSCIFVWWIENGQDTVQRKQKNTLNTILHCRNE